MGMDRNYQRTDMKQLKLSELVLDFSLYPRATVDDQHVGYIAEAMEAGAEMPPIIVDKESKRIIDGFHRFKAMVRTVRKDMTQTIAVEERTYEDDGDMFLDAIRLNATHGHNLTRFDRAHIMIMAKKMRLLPEQVATCLNMTVQVVSDLTTSRTARGVTPRSRVPLKRTIKHMAGKQLTQEQVDANKRLGGMNQLYYVNQIIMLIDADLLDPDNGRLIERLAHLGELISTRVAQLV